MPATGLLRKIAVDTAVWYCLPLTFLVVYVGALGRPASAALPHVLVMALPFVLQAMLRLVLSRLIPSARLRIAASASILALLFGAMIAYYVLVVISVHFWGSVATWSSIPTFLRQAPDVVEAIGFPRMAAPAMAVVFLAALLGICRWYVKRCDWTGELGRAGWMKGICTLAGFCALWLQVANATEAPWIAQEEPLSMSLFPMAGARDIEGHRVTPEQAALLDAIEDKARAAYVPSAAPSKPNVVLIVVDALRPANMSLYGYPRKTTPYLDSLDQTGAVRKFIAHAACSDTACGLLSLSTSRSPRDFSFRPFSLQEALRRNGYGIHVIQSGTYLHPVKEYFGQIDTWFDGTSVDAASMSDDQIILDRVAQMPDWDGRPAMFQFRLMSAHVTRRDDGKGPFQPAKSYILPPRAGDGGGDVVAPAATNFYDNGVRSADHYIEKLLQLLRRKGYLDRAMVVVTADHGEALGEHGMFAHANSVREEVLKVPLLLVAEGYEPRSIPETPGFALQVDIAPTILDELSIPRPATWRGRPLQAPPLPFVGFFEQRDFTGLIDAREPGKIWKYWVDRTWGDEFVFELGTDPRETRNLVGSVPAGMLSAWRTQVLYSRPASSVTTLSARIR